MLEKFLTDKDPELRWRAAELVATLVQNNPYCQDAALKCGLMQVLLQRLDKDEVDMVRVKALLAISGIHISQITANIYKVYISGHC